MNSRTTTGLVAGAAGAALLVGGGTFALWSDSATVDGGTITSGTLDVELVGTPQWQDVSADRADSPHAIDLETFRIVPGDTIEGRYGIDAALEGDNMVAELGLAVGEASGELIAAENGVSVTYSLVDADGAPVGNVTDIAAGQTVEVRFVSADNSAKDPALPVLPAELTGEAQYTVVVTATFDEGTPEQVRTKAAADLAGLAVSLDQVRDAGVVDAS
ncbi:alternate-type signal peptide domain-containing protein [Georgenia sp. 311]|uniref:alternate-type signal peptide domain-containing protein n=1 Tax=Georgenia sp. 311 TaxID=2585134 RepID=UPI0011127F82|nr:alternate-type signal peptide domain-containing protein [Georgenia sp. 311]TNC19757.1 alternate-type signal peptide domain-containing protein [Georgenia sp. 311]